MKFFAQLLVLALGLAAAGCSSLPSYDNSTPGTTDFWNGCVDLPPVAMESCRRSGSHTGSVTM